MKQMNLNKRIVLEMKMSKGVSTHQKKSFFLKKWWDRYLKRLNKLTKGKAQKCC